MSDRYVFLVDDDFDDRYLFREALKSIDAEIPFEYANDGLDAIEKLENMDVPALIFTDLNMPRLNGIELLRRLKNNQSLKEVPVVAYSTSSLKTHINLMFEAGAQHYIIKHDRFDLLCKELKSVLCQFMDLKGC